MEKNLNPEQQKAINHIEGPLLVLAGAGAGKTRVVTERIAHLISIGILPSDILAVTFTNKAALEMKERVRSLTKENILTCTFHSLGARILRETIPALGYKRDFTIYDEDDAEASLKNCLTSLQITEEKGLLKELKGKISEAKNNLLLYSDDLSSLMLSRKSEKIFPHVYALYQSKLKEYNAVDFDDLLFLTVLLFKDNKTIREEFQKRWLFLLIDEYQDTNIAQYNMAKILAEKHGNIFVVGDPDQSIYSWRGAKYQNILNFDKDFPKAKVITLEQNYRSTNNILSAANHLITYNKKRLQKNLWSTYGDGEKIGIFITDTEKQESSFVAETLSHYHVNHHIPLNDIVIFYRTNAQSRNFEDILLSKQIPYVIYGGLSFYQRREIKDLLSFLRMINSDSDFLSFTRTINIPKRGIGGATIEKFLELSEKHKSPILTLCKAYLESPESFPEINLNKKQKEGLFNYYTLIISLRDSVQKKCKVHELLSDLIVKSNYFIYLKEDPESFEDRKQNIEELIAKAIDFEDINQNPTLTSFLEELSLLTNMEKASPQSSVKLMSLHNGKGLEFSLVFIVGMEEDLFPHINTKQDPESIEEERRLCYVGMTRAKKKLFLTASLYRYMWGTPRIMHPSRFLKEIPAKYIDNLSFEEIKTEKEPEEEVSSSQFQIGSQVLHKTFGIGTIKKIYSTSMGETYDVFFEGSENTKTLVAKYAKLKPY